MTRGYTYSDLEVAHETREATIAALRERDGDRCQFPGCDEVLDFTVIAGPQEVTIDHWYSQSYGKANGWTYEEIWDISNLRLMTRKCNSLKSDRTPNPDGTLPPRPEDLRPLHQRRADKSGRVDICETCMSGRLLLQGETCYDCGSGPQPSTLPRYLQVAPKDCSHGWGKNPEAVCWKCWLGFERRRPAIEDVLDTDSLEVR